MASTLDFALTRPAPRQPTTRRRVWRPGGRENFTANFEEIAKNEDAKVQVGSSPIAFAGAVYAVAALWSKPIPPKKATTYEDSQAIKDLAYKCRAAVGADKKQLRCEIRCRRREERSKHDKTVLTNAIKLTTKLPPLIPNQNSVVATSLKSRSRCTSHQINRHHHIIANFFHELFGMKGGMWSPDAPPAAHEREPRLHLQRPKANLFDLDHIAYAIRHIKNGKAVTDEGLSAEMMRALPSTMLPQLLRAVNGLVENGPEPLDTILLEKVKGATDPNKLRAVSKIPPLSKLTR